MKTYEVAITREMISWIKVRAESEEQALELAEEEYYENGTNNTKLTDITDKMIIGETE